MQIQIRLQFLLICCLLVFVECVDRSKFKKCDDASFCKRNRDWVSTGHHKSSQARVDVSIFERISENKLRFRLYSPIGHALWLELDSLRSEILRVRVYETTQTTRYQGPKEVLLPFVSNDSLHQTLQIVGGDDSLKSMEGGKIELKFGSGKAILRVQPFRLDVFNGNEIAFSLNRRNYFQFEHLRAGRSEDSIPQLINDPEAKRPEIWDDELDGLWEPPEIPNPGMRGRWDESFSTHNDTKPRGPQDIGMDISFASSRHLFGLPEHASSFSLKRTISQNGSILLEPYRLWNLDVFEYELNNEMALYGAVPFVVSHSAKQTTGFFWMNAAETWIDISDGHTGVDSHWMSESGVLDVFLLLGPTITNVMEQYASLTGTTPIPPLFSLGYHQCKWNYKSELEVEEVQQKFDDSDLPVDVVWLDIEHTDSKKYFTWDSLHFPTPLKMQQKLKEKGRKLVTIVDPHIKRDDNYYVHQTATSLKHYVKSNEGKDYEGFCWPGSSSWLDYLSSVVRQWWADQFRLNSYQSSSDVLYVWNDMNEPSVFNGPEVTMHKDAKHIGQIEHRDVHNAYGFYMHWATFDGLLQRSNGQQRPFVLTRAFFAGSQRYSAVWTGDNNAAWDHLEISVPMLLSLSISGITFVGADVGGFFNNPDAELLTRWYQLGAFYTFFRGHGHLDSKRKEPYLYQEPYISAMRTALRTHYSLLPFIYTLMWISERTGTPPLRPIWFEFPDEERLFSEQTMFLLGPSLLVKPVVKANQKLLEFNFPGISTNQVWYELHNGYRVVASTQPLSIPAPIEVLPVFIRGGYILPQKERPRRSTTQMIDDPYSLVVAVQDGKSKGELYVDDGNTYKYRNEKEFFVANITFENNRLKWSQFSSNGFQPCGENSSHCFIERITFFGVSNPTKGTILIHKDTGYQEELLTGFEPDRFNPQIGILLVRKPDNCPITSDWELILQF